MTNEHASGANLPRSAALGWACAAALVAACSPAPASDSPQAQERTISSPAQLARVLADPPRNAVLRLAPGDYGAVKLSRKHTPKALDAGLTLVSADPANPARLAELVVSGVTGFTARDLDIGCSAAIQPCAMYLVSVMKSNRVTLQKLRVTGMGGMERGRQYGFFIRDSQEVSVSDSSMTASRYGIGMLNDRSIKVVGNELYGLQTDGIRGGGVSDLLVAENVIGDFTPKPKDHPDGIQLWSTGQLEPARRITIRDNLVVRGGGGTIQGVFVRDTYLQLPFEDISIAGNMVIGGMYNGISLAGARNGDITGNVVIAYPDQKSYIVQRNAPAIRLHGNRAMLFLFPDARPSDMSDNRVIARQRLGDQSAIRDWLKARPTLAERNGPYLRRLLAQADSPRAVR